MTDPDEHVRRLAGESLAGDDPTGWFERLYAQAGAGEAVVPWDRGAPHALLVDWADRSDVRAAGRALVVGCGLGSDAEFVAGLGFDTVAFDVSASAVGASRERFPASEVSYVVADLLSPPEPWTGAFDLVVESLTVQSMPHSVRAAAIENVTRFVAPGGALLVIAFGTDGADQVGQVGRAGPPWPLTCGDVESFGNDELHPVRVERIDNADQPGAFRWRAEFRRGDRRSR